MAGLLDYIGSAPDSVINPGVVGPAQRATPIPPGPPLAANPIPTWGGFFSPPGGYPAGTLLANPMLNRPSNLSLMTPLRQIGGLMGQNAQAGLQQGMFAPQTSIIDMIRSVLGNHVPQSGETNI